MFDSKRISAENKELQNKIAVLEDNLKKSEVNAREQAVLLERAIEELNDSREELAGSKAATFNLLDDVSKEKENVEKEVEKRTFQLREEKALLKSTIESLPLSFFSIDREFKLLDYNMRLARIFSLSGFKSFSEIEEKIIPIISVREKCEAVLKTGVSVIVKEVFHDGEFYKIYFVPVKDEENKTLGVLSLLEDITEQKVAERSKDEFFSIASHELRTPLTAIRGNASMIIDFFLDKLQSKDVEQMIKDIHEASIRLIKIVSDFLDVSRLEQEKTIFKKEPVDMDFLTREAVREFESQATIKGLDLKIAKISGDNLFVLGDRDKIKQIIANLLGNSLNYTRKGGVAVTLEKEGDKIILYVKDTGVGISKENQVLLFRKFQQAQEKILTRDATRSTGLGLYISRLLSDAMGGKVELFESEEGKGSTFRLILPAKV